MVLRTMLISSAVDKATTQAFGHTLDCFNLSCCLERRTINQRGIHQDAAMARMAGASDKSEAERLTMENKRRRIIERSG